ncbi:MAG: thioredoxin domain-containing protein [Candidatus Brocadiales bacterium]|nr:thioredoxin domain-containing protein [Candidatus Brocadiales bacterium]
MGDRKENRLALSTSPYLRSARYQPIDWYEFGEGAFARAKDMDRPILLDIGAVWCHWCHVMDEESYEDPEVAELINKYFIAIKVDRDERPDLDRRYQEAVSALTGQGGWPLTAFLTPEGKAFFGGTYFPPEDKFGREGLKTLLPRIALLYREERSRVLATAEEHHRQLLSLAETGTKAGALSPEQVDSLVKALKEDFDPHHGGFGSGAKFPNEGAVELALLMAFPKGDKDLLNVAIRTMDAMAGGGIRDHIRGGFFRYSVDPHWHVPHFEKMPYVNSGMIKNYVHAYAATGNELYKEVVIEILDYIRREASDPELGGFYASQDADIGKGDDGDYYTWTPEEVDGVLTPQESRAIKSYYGIEAEGEMERNAAKNVLMVVKEVAEVAGELNLPQVQTLELIKRGREKLLEARNRPPRPFVDTNKYAHWNGMMVSAYLEAYKFLSALGGEGIKDFALKSLDFMLEKAYQKGRGLYHSYHEGQALGQGLLEDQVFMAEACLEAYEVTGEKRYLETAQDIVDYCLKDFWDDAKGGFFDLPQVQRVAIQRGEAADYLSGDIPRKPFEDLPTPAGNAVAARVLDRLFYITYKKEYREASQRTLEAYAGSASESGRFASSYALALEYHLKAPTYAVIIGKKGDAETLRLWKAALGAYRPGKIVTVHDPAEESSLPYPARPDGRPVVYVCIPFGACAPPTQETDKMVELLRTMGI